MDLFSQINADIKAAMKNKEQEKLTPLRAIKSELLLAKTAEGASDEISEEQGIKILQKMVKQRKDSANVFTEQGRAELAEKEEKEAEVIEAYLPAQMSIEDVEAEVQLVINEVGATSMKEMGAVMQTATKKLAGKTDGKTISGIVRKLLS